MKMTSLLTLALLWCALPAFAADRPEIILWPQGMPEPVVPAEPPEDVKLGADGISRRTHVSKPRLVVHLPPKDVAASGAAVIVVPGGGFGVLADGHEGSEACEWLAKQGVVSFLLLHRAPTSKHPAPNAGPVQDAQKAVSDVRRLAADYGIDPHKIGVLGFSAGGQVTVIAATNDLKFPTSAPSAAPIASHKPDFLLLLYPYQIYDPATKFLRKEINLDGGLPPTFIAQMGDDTGSLAQGSALLYFELINRKIPAELHIYQRGGHGFGMRARPNSTGPTDWTHRATDWLKQGGLVK